MDGIRLGSGMDREVVRTWLHGLVDEAMDRGQRFEVQTPCGVREVGINPRGWVMRELIGERSLILHWVEAP